MKAALVPVQNLRCWGCKLLHKNEKRGVYCCPQNAFYDADRFLPDFACRCEKYIPAWLETKS